MPDELPSTSRSVDKACRSHSGEFAAASSPSHLAQEFREYVLDNFPNDLTRMIYLSSLRDCNSGLYLHAALSGCGVQAADQALRRCHEDIFRLLLLAGLEQYVTQLREYIRYTQMSQQTVLETWKSLRAYRATVPTSVLPYLAELFCLNLDIALQILQRDASALANPPS